MAHKRPLTLTRTERTRFINTYYALWSLMRLECWEWDSRLRAMRSQELYYLRAMTRLRQSIGQEEIVPFPCFGNKPPSSLHSLISGRSEKRIALQQETWNQIQFNSQRFFQRDAQNPPGYLKHGSVTWFGVLRDEWQSCLKKHDMPAVCDCNRA